MMQYASEQTAELAKARQSVMRAVPSIYKGSQHQQGWSYAGEADILMALQPAMVEHGLDIAPVKVVVTVEPAQRKDWTQTNVVVTYRMTHASGQWMLMEAAGNAVDKEGRDAAKAMTSAYKSVLTQAFALATTDQRAPSSGRHTRAPERRDERPQQGSNAGAGQAGTGQHPSWKAVAQETVSRIAQHGLHANDVSNWCVAHDKPKLSAMAPQQRAGLLAFIESGGGVDRIQQWLAAQRGA